MRFKIVRFTLFALLGVFLYYMGHTPMEWEFWVVIVCSTLIGVVGYFDGKRDEKKRNHALHADGRVAEITANI